MKFYKELEEKTEEIFKINNIVNILYWDLSTITPPLSAQNKKEEIAYLKQLSHQKLTSMQIKDLIYKASKEKKNLNQWQLANLREIIRRHEIETCVSKETQVEHINNTIECEEVWHKASVNNDFSMVFPYLKKVVTSTRQLAQQKQSYYPNKTTYEILIDQYDPGRTVFSLKEIFFKLKSSLPEIIQEIRDKQSSEQIIPILNKLSTAQQLKLNKKLAKIMGFDFRKGRIDYSKHYFCGGSPYDVRLLVKKNNNFLDNIMKVIHEVGHGLYEQNLPISYKNQPVGKASGMAAHESQSLMMETHIAKSQEFMSFLSRILRDDYNLNGIEYSAENLYKHATRISPSSIRLSSDELTYLLHIVLRYEIEEELIEGDMDLKNLPEIWNKKMRLYLGISPKSLKEGCMQDIHWFKGYFGYFPSYCMGTILSFMMIHQIKEENRDTFQNIKEGNFDNINQWLNKNIRSYGSFKTIEELVEEKVGKKLSVSLYLDNIKRKYLKS